MEGISRIDSKHTHGWFVRVYYEASREHRKFFSDGPCGGKDEALQQAIEYRDEYKRKYPPPEKLPFQRKPTAANTSGVNGISETFSRSKRTGKKLPCFSVFWAPKKNTRKNKRFYLSHYGSREEAFEAAVEFRKEKEAEILRLEKLGQRG